MAHFTGWLIVLSLLSTLCYKLVSWLLYRSAVERHGCSEPPHYPHKVPFFGLDHFVNTMNAFKNVNFLDYKASQFTKYGKTFETNNFGTVLFETIDPEVSKAVFSTHATKFGLQPLRYETAKHLWGNGIIVVDGAHWQRGRALIRASFDVVHIANFERLRKHTETFLSLLPKDGATVDLIPLFKSLILDTSSEFILGESMGALSNSKECDDFMEAFAYAQKGTAIRSMLGRYKFLHRDKRWWEACKQVTDYADIHVEEALRRREKRGERVQGEKKERLRLVDEMAEETQDRLTLRSLVISVFSPAHDGAAVTLSNAMFHLARSHRVTTIATLNQRQCLESTILPFGGGPNGKEPLYVPKGAIMEINYRAMCRDPTFWGSDAHLFKPERWEHVRPGWEYTPFGGGPRSCPGMRLVFTECAYVLVNLLRRFKEVQNRDSELEWKEEMRMTFQSKNGCLVGLISE
ncbi:cytochrome P450 [Pleomassaria siparia CBS 279.74]|uniref:Cytochrome P450 n=1 Tax=Pleomassaria siparia CBS 279.74 TaxID=1314801 RepID=A0A6G1KBG2_9PLEO|nr:cytochrome P450 [Pleomassaria siparia CBS 279.74]